MFRTLALLATLTTLASPVLASPPGAGGRLLAVTKARASQNRQNVRAIRAMQSSIEARYGGAIFFGRSAAITPDRALVRSVAQGARALQRLGLARRDRFAYVELMPLPIASDELARSLALDVYGNFSIASTVKTRGGSSETKLVGPSGFDLTGIDPVELRRVLTRIDKAIAGYDGGPLPAEIALRTR
jgi:hypothetical protein